MLSGIQGAASSFLSFASASPNLWESLFKHSFSQAWLAGASGGNMKHGFMSGFASALGGAGISKFASNASLTVKVASNAVVGGTVAQLGGGKFANGAVTGAFVMLFNDLVHENEAEVLQDQLNKVFENYPMNGNNEISTQEAFSRVSPAAEKLYLDGDPSYQNACATKLSLAFVKAGIKIPSGYGGLKDVNGNRIIISATQMQKFMSSKYGSLMTTYSSETSTNGIYIGLTKSGMGYSGHVTIIKSDFNSNTYSSSMKSMYFWKIP